MTQIYKSEMLAIVRAMETVEEVGRTGDVSAIVLLSDANGEALGRIDIGDAGDYAFFPHTGEPRAVDMDFWMSGPPEEDEDDSGYSTRGG